MFPFRSSAKGIFCLFLGCLAVVPLTQAAAQVQRWQHASGAQVALVHSPGLPMLDLRIEFDGGSRRDPAAQAGLADATALLSQRGLHAHGSAPALDENALTEAWMDLGAQWTVAAGRDRFSASLRTLTDADVLPQALALAGRALAHPALLQAGAGDTPGLEAVWARERERLSAAWRNAATQPATVAQRRLAQAVFGSHPYGAEATPETLAAMALPDTASHWRRTVQPCRARISLVGALSRAEADAAVSDLLAPLQAAPWVQACSQLQPLPGLPEVQALVQPAEVRVPMAAAQAQVLLGQPGHSRTDPDFLPLLVGNYILGGGGFVSRMTTEVREKRGLSYGAYTYFSPGEHAGAFTAGLQTRPDQAEAALAVAREVIARFVADGPTDAELAAAQAFLVNGLALRTDSNRKLLDQVASMLWFNLPDDELATWARRVQQVTRADIHRAFARVLQPGRMVAVVVGGVQ
jgi:zinc protease